MGYLYILEAANLFVGDNGPDNDKTLVMETCKLPDMEEIVASFHSTASFGALEIGGLGLKEMMIDFKCAGIDIQTLNQFGLFGQPNVYYTIYGATRNKADNSLHTLKCIVWGRLKKVANDAYKRGEIFGQSFTVSEIQHYELFFDGNEEFFYDWSSQSWRVNGQNQIADVNNALGLSSA